MEQGSIDDAPNNLAQRASVEAAKAKEEEEVASANAQREEAVQTDNTAVIADHIDQFLEQVKTHDGGRSDSVTIVSNLSQNIDSLSIGSNLNQTVDSRSLSSSPQLPEGVASADSSSSEPDITDAGAQLEPSPPSVKVLNLENSSKDVCHNNRPSVPAEARKDLKRCAAAGKVLIVVDSDEDAIVIDDDDSEEEEELEDGEVLSDSEPTTGSHRGQEEEDDEETIDITSSPLPDDSGQNDDIGNNSDQQGGTGHSNKATKDKQATAALVERLLKKTPSSRDSSLTRMFATTTKV